MHHKRGRCKNRRSGCLMCKMNKMNGWPDVKYHHTGFGKIRDLVHSQEDLNNEMKITAEERWEMYEE